MGRPVAAPRREAALRVFLDENILFSATLGGESFDLLWRIAAAGTIRLVTSPFCIAEAETNLARKRPASLRALHDRLTAVDVVPDAAALPDDDDPGLPDKDAPVWWAARAAAVDVLVTGDVRHFGALMERPDVRPRVRTVRAFLLEDPPLRPSRGRR